MSKEPQAKALHVQVDTFDSAGQQVGTRVVDMYHFGTRNWLANHTWWAMHNGHTVRQQLAELAEAIEELKRVA